MRFLVEKKNYKLKWRQLLNLVIVQMIIKFWTLEKKLEGVIIYDQQ